MKNVEKVSTVSALSYAVTSTNTTSELELKRLVQQPRSMLPDQSTVTAQHLVGLLKAHPDTDRSSLCMDVNGESLPIRVAHSCLLRVEVGDWVQAVLADGMVWVLAVLTKHAPQAGALRQIDFGDSELHITAKKISMTATQQVDIHAPLLTQAAKNRQSHIDGTDSARVGNNIVHADGHLSMHARSAMVTAASLLKIDAAQIHMG